MPVDGFTVLIVVVVIALIALIIVQSIYSNLFARATNLFSVQREQISEIAAANVLLGQYNAEYRGRVERYSMTIYQLQQENTELQRRVNAAQKGYGEKGGETGPVVPSGT